MFGKSGLRTTLSLVLICFLGATFVLVASIKPAYAFSVSVIRPISFGTIIADPSGVDIVIDAKSGDVPPVASSSGTATISGGHCAKLLFTGHVGKTLTINMDHNVELRSGNDVIFLREIVNNSESDPADSGAPDELRIGGKLKIPAGYKAGDYSGSLTITITYQ